MQAIHLASAVTPKSFDASKRTFEVQFYSGATVPRYDFWKDEEYDLTFDMSPAAVDLSRFKAGAPLIKDHYASIDNTVGVVEDAWLDGGKGYAKIRLSQRDDVAPLAQDIESGIIRNVSMGAASLEEQPTRDKSGRKHILVTKWMPMELSLVPIPADHKAQILSAGHPGEAASAAREYIQTLINQRLEALPQRLAALVRLEVLDQLKGTR